MEGFAPLAFYGTGDHPLIIDRWEIIPDTGAAGLHRGGNGVDVAYRFLGAGTIAIYDDRWLTYPWGVKGGEPSARGTTWIDRADGTRDLAASALVAVGKDDVLHFVTWGGGGWGDPLARDPELVCKEVRRGLVTQAGARTYGVVCDDDGDLDAAATDALRASTREGRKEPLPPVQPGRLHGEPAGQQPHRDRTPGPEAPAGMAVTAPDRASSQKSSSELSGDFSSGFDGHLTPGPRQAVIVVDLMRAYFDPSSPLCLPSADCLVGAAAVLAQARTAGYPVFHTVVRFESEEQGGVFMRKVPALRLLIRESPGLVPPLGELMPEVAPLEGEPVLVKQGASAFFGTDLAGRLREADVDTVIIVGVSTSGCVRATAVDAVQHSFVPIVVRDAVGDRDDAVQQSALYDLQAKYAEVVYGATLL